MLILLNSTKTMDPHAARPPGLRGTRPRRQTEADELAARVARLPRARMASLLDVRGNLADAARAAYAAWGGPGAVRGPTLAVFTGLVYKHLDPISLPIEIWRDAQVRIRILSGLYGVLRPLDLIAAYRLEMGCRFAPPGAANLAAFWRGQVTADLNSALRRGQTVLNLAAQEYLRAVDVAALQGPLLAPVFKERRRDGSLKAVPVHAKMARGAMARFALARRARSPGDLLAFSAHGWEPDSEPPAAGSWLFTRPARD